MHPREVLEGGGPFGLLRCTAFSLSVTRPAHSSTFDLFCCHSCVQCVPPITLSTLHVMLTMLVHLLMQTEKEENKEKKRTPYLILLQTDWPLLVLLCSIIICPQHVPPFRCCIWAIGHLLVPRTSKYAHTHKTQKPIRTTGPL